MKRCRRILYRQEQTHTLNAASRPKELSPVYDLLSSVCKFCQETTRCFSVNYNSYVDSWENPRQTVLPYPANEVAFVEPFSSLKNRLKFPRGLPTFRKIHDEVENMLAPSLPRTQSSFPSLFKYFLKTEPRLNPTTKSTSDSGRKLRTWGSPV